MKLDDKTKVFYYASMQIQSEDIKKERARNKK